MTQKYSRISTEINPPYALDLDMVTMHMEEARPPVIALTLPCLELGGLLPLNPCKIVTTRRSVYSYPTKCLATTIDSFYHSMKPSIPYSNIRQGEPYYAGYRSGTEQVPLPAMSFSPRLPEAGPNQDASSEWRFHNGWVSHAEEDEIHLTIALKKS